MLHRFAVISISAAMALNSCKQKPEPVMPTQEELIKINQLSAKKEAIQIQQFADDHKWPTTKTGSGLHYYIYEHGTGDSAKTEKLVTVKMTLMLLNGDTAYSWKENGNESFVIDHDNNEIGLHEALKYMRVGDKAKVILPSHLAFGGSGDRDRIPPKSSVVYDIELVGLK